MYTTEGKKIVSTEKAPKAIGPYSQAIRTENLVFTAGQIGLDPATMTIVEGGIEAQTRQVLTNLKHVLEAANSGLNFVVKTTVFLQDMGDFAAMNAVYARVLPGESACAFHGRCGGVAQRRPGRDRVRGIALSCPRRLIASHWLLATDECFILLVEDERLHRCRK